jgi:hypothetical protein
MDTIMPPAAVQATADQAAELIAKLQEILPLSDDLLLHDRKVANSRKGVPTSAIQAAVSILEELGEKAGGYDLAATREALAMESSLGGVATKLRLLADRVDATIAKRRSAAVATTGGLYKSLQGLARGDGSVVPYLARLRPHVVGNRGRSKSPKASAQAPAPTAAATPATVTTGNGPLTITPNGVTVDATQP